MASKITWNYDVDVALAAVKSDNKPLFLDFSAAPG